MLTILRASCEQALVTLEAARISTGLTDDLDKMIERVDTELAALKTKLEGAERFDHSDVDPSSRDRTGL